ncbi:3-dehydroquinate synthase [Chromobacterium vaccinii]|uniref:sedoheptulose 7-phosphate cyclase n=1 Tax=Chromobacterium vaccinii TaxID=1108595 RepID=UPI0009E63DDF|nr:sedoheptulose 7-phosphate cyclase [Chromobacterium vaccinii]QND86330.1 3-dehydroquinate synthase [Chromobacterium vaccinii]QND91561.1 3-dehydroquinate synthase [Chromobacterium vaccinii]
MEHLSAIENLRTLSLAESLTKHPDLNWRVSAVQAIKYNVTLSRGLFEPSNATLAHGCGAGGARPVRRLVVIDAVVHELYGDKIQAYFDAWNIVAEWKIMRGHESSKTMEQALEVSEAMTAAGLLRRNEVVIVIGGGVLMDIVGFAASLYRRGIPYIRVPTTLMGQIDAGIGIKTGVNHGYHKNRLGTYCAPEAAYIDPVFLQTLEQRHIANGVSEIIKMALIKDRALFELLEEMAGQLDADTFATNHPKVSEILSRAIAGMLAELEPNLWEDTLERSVDYGHTFSPSLELRADPELLHGEAVAVDMALSVALALGRGLLDRAEAERAIKLIARAGLPIFHPTFTTELVVGALQDTIKHRDGLQRVPLTRGIGQATFVNDLEERELASAIDYLRTHPAAGVFAAETVDG